jgi:hypothetical protein
MTASRTRSGVIPEFAKFFASFCSPKEELLFCKKEAKNFCLFGGGQ